MDWQRKSAFYNFTLVVILFVVLIETTKFVKAQNFGKTENQNSVECLNGSVFYRDPGRPVHSIWTTTECSKYFLCLEGEVFNFKCSEGLLFDVLRQICDFKQNVENCDMTTATPATRPLLSKAHCTNTNYWGCADGTCLPAYYFCDGSVDCPDDSDEFWCDVNSDPNAAEPCDIQQCQLPDCLCSQNGLQHPGHFDVKSIPQMILLTFEGAINSENWHTISQIFSKLSQRNPNKCPIRATFYISHSYSNYQLIQKLWNDGHEIAVNSITRRSPEIWWSKNASVEDWFDEMVGQANILNRFAYIRMEEIRGLRVPFLSVGWNRQFLMMKEFGFVYDSSIIAPFANLPFWPYTLDYKMPHLCSNIQQNCPSRSYSGVWEIVLNPLQVDDYTCNTIDSCPLHFNGDDIYRIFIHNFKRHYLTNRAPYGLHFKPSWLKKAENMKALLKFINELKEFSDVYFITNQQAIQWMRHPTPNHFLHQFEPWTCKPRKFDAHEISCKIPNVCKLHSQILQEYRYLYTCQKCPLEYPWIRNEFGLE